MTKELQIFNYQSQEVRTVIKDGEPWFVAKDLCKILEIDNTQTRRLDDDEKGLCSIHTLGGIQELQVVTESGLYNLVLGSRKPEAKLFKRWLTHEVIPSIRKYGMYAKDELLDNPDLLLDVVSKLKQERDKRLQVEEENREKQAWITENKPKVDFADRLLKSKDTILVRQYAKTLQEEGFKLGEGKLYKWFREKKYLMANNEPYQKFIKYFVVKENVVTNKYGKEKITKTPKIKPEGQFYFYKKLKQEGLIA